MRSLFLLALITGCTTATPDTSDQLDAPVGKADAASRPSGSYQNPTPHFGELSVLTLNDDHTYTSYQLGACPGGGSCTPILQTGTYLFTHGSSKHYLRFYSDDGTTSDRYQWTLSAGALSLELDGSDAWFTLTQSGSCEAAGGTCVPLVPDACQIGSIGDATQYSCGSGDGVECCLPPAHDNSCAADADCTGLLPQFCRQCSDGSDACAHWSCVANACQITTCS